MYVHLTASTYVVQQRQQDGLPVELQYNEDNALLIFWANSKLRMFYTVELSSQHIIHTS